MIGDGLMAVFGAPLPIAEPPLAAVRAALDMIEMIELLNVERAAEDKAPIHIGIGIASGVMVAGYTGTQQRATYTCVGRTVNLAARLEAHTKEAQRTILIDGDTLAALPPDVQVEVLGRVPLKVHHTGGRGVLRRVRSEAVGLRAAAPAGRRSPTRGAAFSRPASPNKARGRRLSRPCLRWSRR